MWSHWSYALFSALTVTLCLLWLRISFAVQAIVADVKRDHGALWMELGQPNPQSLLTVQTDLLLAFIPERPNFTRWLLLSAELRLRDSVIAQSTRKLKAQLGAAVVLTGALVISAGMALLS